MIDTDGTIVPSRIARLKTKISDKVEANKTEYAYWAGVTIGTISATTGAVIVAKYRLGQLDKLCLQTLDERNRALIVASDLIDFVEENKLGDKARKFIADRFDADGYGTPDMTLLAAIKDPVASGIAVVK